MNNQLNLDGQLVESNLLESELESSLLLDDSLNVRSPELQTLELNTKSVDSTNNLDLFADSETETSPLYSTPIALNTGDNELPEDNELPGDNEPEILPDESTDMPVEEPNVPLTETITVGNPEGTQFTFNFAEDTSQEVIDGLAQAGENWSSVLKDDVNINIDFTFEPIDGLLGSILGIANPNFVPIPYTEVNEALTQDITSTTDRTAVDNLPQGESVNYLINNTAENNGSDTPYLDDNGGLNNSNISLTSANAKALGISLEERAAQRGASVEDFTAVLNARYGTEIDPNAPDARPVFNSNANWDFDPSDGITSDASDFVGVVTHELGHALGFFSNAEILDLATVNTVLDIIEISSTEEIQQLIADSGLQPIAEAIDVDRLVSENEYLPSTMDLFRFTLPSVEQGARDFTTNNIDGKFFSIDGGQTEIAPLAEGLIGELNVGGFSHWQDNLGIGILDPTIVPGELGQISDNDLLALDVVGWDVA